MFAVRRRTLFTFEVIKPFKLLGRTLLGRTTQATLLVVGFRMQSQVAFVALMLPDRVLIKCHQRPPWNISHQTPMHLLCCSCPPRRRAPDSTDWDPFPMFPLRWHYSEQVCIIKHRSNEIKLCWVSSPIIQVYRRLCMYNRKDLWTNCQASPTPLSNGSNHFERDNRIFDFQCHGNEYIGHQWYIGQTLSKKRIL